MDGLIVFMVSAVVLVLLDELARRKCPAVRTKILLYLGALYPAHRK
jgi:hypothetical protein